MTNMTTAASCCCLYPRCITKRQSYHVRCVFCPSTWHHFDIDIRLVIGLGTIKAVCDCVSTIVGCCSCNIIEQRPSVLASDQRPM